MTNTPHLNLPDWIAGQDQPWTAMNEAMHTLDAVVQLSVISDALATPPAAPTEGDRYIVAASATGAWAGWEGGIAAFISGIWVKIMPTSGWMAWVGNRSSHFVYNAGWTAFSTTSPYDFGISFGGTPTASEIMGRLSIPRAVTCPANLAGSAGHVGVNPTASFIINVNDDAALIGAITIAVDGTFSFSSVGGLAINIAAGSLITFVAPATVDATIADVTATMIGGV